MTTWYFDSVNGSDSNNGTSASTPKQNYSAFPLGLAAPGDTFLFKRGTTQTITTAYKGVKNGISSTVRARYGAYGTAQVAYSTWRYGATGSIILNAAASQYIDFEDMYFDMRGTDCRNPINFASLGTSDTIGNAIRRCFFVGSNRPVIGGGSGLTIQQAFDATGIARDYVVEDCEFFDNDTHGLMIIGGQNIQVRRCKFYRNGAKDPNGGHGFSARYNRTDATSGWTNASGTIWKKTLAANELDVYYVQTSIAECPKVRRTAGTATSPGIGEYGVSGGALYINLNSASNPSGQGIRYAWGKCSGLLVEQCESHDNYWNQAAPNHEGHGFAFDDFSDNSIFTGNKAYSNQGAGFSINRGGGNKVVGNIAYSNWQSALVSNPADQTNVVNNTFYWNNTGTGALSGEIVFFGYGRNSVVSNNIIISSKSYGIASETTDTGFTGTKNNILMIGGGVAEKNPFVTSTVSADPQLDSLYRPQAAAVIKAGIYLGGSDFYGKQFNNPPNIGGVDTL
ncbi:MAG TPA: right-handed parallel beta-helix repeat-containing protein [Nitrosospira sp.]